MTAVEVIWDLAAIILWAHTLWRVGRRPAADYPRGWTGKTLTILAVALLWVTLGQVSVPAGALAVRWRRRRRRDPAELPLADRWPGR